MIARCGRSRLLLAAAAAIACSLVLMSPAVGDARRGAGIPPSTTFTLKGKFAFPAGSSQVSFTRRWTDVRVSLEHVSIDLPRSTRIVLSLKPPDARRPLVFRNLPTSKGTHCRSVGTRVHCLVGPDDFTWGWTPPGRWVFTLKKPTPKPASVILTLQFALAAER